VHEFLMLTPVVAGESLSAGGALAAAELALAGGAGLLALAAGLARRLLGREGWVWLEAGGGLLAVSFLLRLLEALLGVASAPVLVASHGTVEGLAVGGLLLGLHRLRREGRLPGATDRLAALLVVGSALLGLLGRPALHPLLHASLPAVFCQLAFLMGTSFLVGRAVFTELSCGRERAREESLALATVHRKLSRDLEANDRRNRELERRGRELREESQLFRQRVVTLEKILAVATRIHATRDLSDLLDQVAHAVREFLGFRMVLLRLYSPSTRAFEARSFAGIPEEGKAHLTSIQVSLEDYRKLSHPRFRISESYFISHEDEEAAATMADAYVPDLGPRAEGEWHEDDALIVPLIAPGGEIKGYLSVDDPVDRRVPSLLIIRQIEFLARHAATAIESAEVYDRLAKNNAELAHATEMLGSLSEMKNNFLANVSHELRTPLTSIKAYAELLQQDSGALSEETRQEFTRIIAQEGERLSGIIDDILELSRMEGGQASVETREIDLVSLLRRLEEPARERAAARSIDFALELPPGEIPISVDTMLVQQMLDHLLGNAFKFTPELGAVRLRAIDHGPQVEIIVEDTGIGIPEEKMRYIFDHFYQADGSSTREHGGQGLGLAICRDIVDFHEGRIWAENRPDGGASFHVALPRRARVVQRAGREPSAPSVTARSTTDRAEFLENLMQWLAETLEVEIVSLMLPDATHHHLEIAAAIGLPDSVVQSTRLPHGGGIAGKVWASGRTLHLADVTSDRRLGKRRSEPRYTTPSLLSVPLIRGLEVVGVVNANNRRDGRPLDGSDRLLLEALAPQLTFLIERIEEHDRGEQRYRATQEALRAALAIRRERCGVLADQCRRIALAVARQLRLPSEELAHLAFALQYYDVGLVKVPPQILQKRAPLTSDERAEIDRHVHAGLELLEPLEIPPKVRQIILHHHERCDGTGYPEGLEGEAIPIGARLVALADSLSAMLQERPYREARGVDEALAEFERLSGSQYCARLTEPFVAEAQRCRQGLLACQQAAGGEKPSPAATVDAGAEGSPAGTAVLSSGPPPGR
jgi:signal transduction histidine kinase/response regulator RpfG family c-di-GMP phosphodiesterase